MYRQTGIFPKYESNSLLFDNFKLNSLEYRRNILDLLFLFKIIHHKIDSVYLNSRLQLQVPTLSTRAGNTGLFYTNTNVLKMSPISRMCNLYNQISKTPTNTDVFSMPEQTFRSVSSKSILMTELHSVY